MSNRFARSLSPRRDKLAPRLGSVKPVRWNLQITFSARLDIKDTGHSEWRERAFYATILREVLQVQTSEFTFEGCAKDPRLVLPIQVKRYREMCNFGSLLGPFYARCWTYATMRRTGVNDTVRDNVQHRARILSSQLGTVYLSPVTSTHHNLPNWSFRITCRNKDSYILTFHE